MNLLFYYSAERVFKDECGNLYTSGNFTPEVWDRYLSISDNLSVIMTDSGKIISKEEAMEKKQLIDTEKINMILLPERFVSLKSYFSLKRKRKTDKIQRDAFEANDFAIIRSANSSVLGRCRRWGIPYAIEVVGCLWDAFWNHSIKGKVMAPFQFLKSKYNVRKAPYALYVTNEFLQKRYPTKGKNVNCSNVSLHTIDPEVLKERLEKIKNKSGKLIIGTAAACDVRYKGQQYVIKALSILKKQGLTDFRYDIVGAGDPSYLLGVAEKYGVSDQINIVGQLSHDKVMEWLKGIDLYIQPSLQEGLPRSVIEAMSVGLPCMGTNIAGIPELINKSMLFKRKSSKDIARIIKGLNTDVLLELSKENFEEAKNYHYQILSKRRTEFYNDFRKYAEEKKEATR